MLELKNYLSMMVSMFTSCYKKFQVKRMDYLIKLMD